MNIDNKYITGYSRCILSTLFCGSETWTKSVKQENQLESSHPYCLDITIYVMLGITKLSTQLGIQSPGGTHSLLRQHRLRFPEEIKRRLKLRSGEKKVEKQKG